jgi:uncharacterized protein (UPF0261 family)
VALAAHAARVSDVSTVLLPGTLDTKGDEYAFVRDIIHARGHKTLVMDLGVQGEPAFKPDIGAAQVAAAGGTPLKELRAKADRGIAVDTMTNGARAMTRELFGKNAFDGVLGLGGGGGTTMITAAMRELPFGVPKVMLSTMASGNTTPYVDVKDITMMHSVVDIAGINRLSAMMLTNAANAVCGMLDGGTARTVDKPAIAATMFGVTTACVTEARKRLEAAGYQVVVFHATGSGGRAMEALIADGVFSAVLDVTTTEWADEVVGGVLTAGPTRLAAAARTGIPQVVSVGALDMVNFGGIETVPARFRDRNLYKHNATVTLMRTTPAECADIGKRIAEMLNAATGPVVLMLPLNGISAIDAPGKPFHDADADGALFDSLRKHLRANVTVREIDAHINDTQFAHALADELLTHLSRH